MKRITSEETVKYLAIPIEDPSIYTRAVAFTLTPIDDEWEEVQYYGESIEDPSYGIKKPEWVYVLVNRHIPGVCKIGMTTTSVRQRVDEINSATGVITPWYPAFSFKCVNSRYLEQDIHRYLEERGCRLNPRREGFEIDSTTAIAVIKSLGSRYHV